ncbi:MAG: DUF4089 domain-containing protein [Bradyrhizobiaceae bacterium]|nr:MAG: DUF4089 domain-containing protein [Bradyrhizobiaceae bacterium]
MTDPELDLYIDAASRALGLRIDDQWRAAVRFNLGVSLNFCRLIDEFPFDDDFEPANTFTA